VMELAADGAVDKRSYWQLRFGGDAADAARDENEWREALLAQLRAAVRRRLVAAVDVGVLLSGGVDSSLLVALMVEAGTLPHTYSVGFEAAGGEAGDEFLYSDLIAETFGT